MNIQVSTKHMSLLECFSSETRVRIIELLNSKSMNIKELAEQLNVSSAIITKHIQKLEEAGILRTHNAAGVRGTQKICSLALDSLTLQLRTSAAVPEPLKYTVEIPIGQYADYLVQPTCGLVSESKVIGMFDDPRYFSDPERMTAAHLWFGSGYVEYRVPNYLHSGQKPRHLEFSFEICSEAPSYNENWPSDITFYVNEVELGMWTCPGDFGSKRGIFTPRWWDIGTQHGLLKTLSVQQDGTYLDGVKLSEKGLNHLPLRYGEDIRLRLASLESSRHCGGMNLFGKGFGNYDQDIVVTIHYEETDGVSRPIVS
ncbi:ArsR family transcriptional regulator [Paenibacillus swuensis]|uniref:ArsR family transcriptional regulator n=1 Tax=Paenibacillus swuensis TaxID=1178515 RepID=A0A172TN79_9BACL|nr:ArsR family transcriptional regulator [Paenibacillus swuensis]ANE48203.1 ArsR family transcriptional regulator [Paenibacillus swuensis]